MTATTFFFVLLCAWLVVGVVCGVVMARLGHDAWSWGTLGALLGPLVIPVALAARRDARPMVERVVRVGRAGPGPVSVLVGVDGSPESHAVASGAASLFGPRLGRLTLATAIDYDTRVIPPLQAESKLADAQRLLADAARILDEDRATGGSVDPDMVVLSGPPAHALLEYARSHNYDLLAVGARGRGLSRAVLGSVAVELVRQRDVFVLMAGAAAKPVHAE